jgi:hypothetical protein
MLKGPVERVPRDPKDAPTTTLSSSTITLTKKLATHAPPRPSAAVANPASPAKEDKNKPGSGLSKFRISDTIVFPRPKKEKLQAAATPPSKLVPPSPPSPPSPTVHAPGASAPFGGLPAPPPRSEVAKPEPRPPPAKPAARPPPQPPQFQPPPQQQEETGSSLVVEGVKYRVLCPIGRGGSSVVYSALDPQDAPVAIKYVKGAEHILGALAPPARAPLTPPRAQACGRRLSCFCR